MGLNKNERISFLKISDGKVRMKTTQDDPQAEERFDSINNKYMYERVYSSCEGYLRDIKVQTHDEYGTMYNLIMFDPQDGAKYSLSVSEDSRYFQSLCMLLPNVDFAKSLTVKPFSFKNDKSQNIGLSFEQDGEKVANYYKDWDEKSETSTAKNGLEDFDFSEVKGDKEETKILQMRLRKFLKAELKKQLKRLLEFVQEHSESEIPKENPEVEETETPKKKTSKKEVEEDEAEKPAKKEDKKKSAPAGKEKSGTKKRNSPY